MFKHEFLTKSSSYPIMYGKFLFVITLVKYVDSEFERFIMEGEYADIRHYPHQIFFEVYGTEPCMCGGSILNQMIALTAAHCLEELPGIHGKVILKYGSASLRHMRSQVAKSFMIHEKYNYETMYGDIAIVGLKTPIELSDIIKKVAITPTPPEWKLGYVAGWGAINEQLDTQDMLKYAKQKLQSVNVCTKLGIPVGAFCAGPIKGPGNPAVGDSGGALIINDYIQTGIVSYKVHYYTLVAYTNVSYYYPWIYRNSQYLYCVNKN